MTENNEFVKDSALESRTRRLHVQLDNPLVLGMLEVLASQKQGDVLRAVNDLGSLVNGLIRDYRPDIPFAVSVSQS